MVAAADKVVAEALERKGWETLTSGWPDILAFQPKTRRVMAVELKRGSDRLRPEQQRMQSVFVDLMGVPFHIARDEDIKALMQRRGRIVLPGESIGFLEFEARELRANITNALQRLEHVERSIARATHVFGRAETSKERADAEVAERVAHFIFGRVAS